MAFTSKTIAVSTTATLILAANTTQKKRRITNVGTAKVYVGSNNSVVTTSGFPIAVGGILNISDFNGTVYGIVAADTENVDYVEDE